MIPPFFLSRCITEIYILRSAQCQSGLIARRIEDHALTTGGMDPHTLAVFTVSSKIST